MNKIAILLVMLCIGFDALSQTLTITSIREVAKLKRGKSYEINWSGGQQTDAITVALVNKKHKVTSLATLTNSGSTSIRIPSRTRPGKYSITVTNTTSGEIASSQPIKLRRRIPLAVQIATVVIIPLTLQLLTPPQPLPMAPNDPN